MSAWMSCETAWSMRTAESVRGSLRLRTVDPCAEGGGSNCGMSAAVAAAATVAEPVVGHPREVVELSAPLAWLTTSHIGEA